MKSALICFITTHLGIVPSRHPDGPNHVYKQLYVFALILYMQILARERQDN